METVAETPVVEETKAVNNMDALFSKINLGSGLGLAGIFAVVLIRWLLKKRPKAEKKKAKA